MLPVLLVPARRPQNAMGVLHGQENVSIESDFPLAGERTYQVMLGVEMRLMWTSSSLPNPHPHPLDGKGTAETPQAEL
jgi:hypothetical protein